ncbi:MAG: HAMP domain-containing protein [Myxococcales bacterium]|nr:HAMP domain-containing protein [Myxococcales bacterium]
MNQTIRGRIALWAFTVFLVLLALEGALVLGGLKSALREVADQGLLEKLDDLSSEVADSSLRELLASANDPRTHLSDLVFEIRDRLDAEIGRDLRGSQILYTIHRDTGRSIARSGNLGEHVLPHTGTEEIREGASFRDEIDPRWTSQAIPLRVVELRLGAFRIDVARSLSPFASIYLSARTKLAVILAGVTFVAALGAYWIASRALSPVRDLIAEARRLQTLSEGNLPRTGRRDEIDDLAGVLNDLLDRVRADVLRVRQFTADAAHEIRTPLAAIRGHLELLFDSVDEGAQVTLGGVLEEVERLSRLVNQLLLLEKLEDRADVAAFSPIDLGSLVADLVDHLGIVAEEQGIQLEARTESVETRGDPERLRQIFLNLIDNAFKHTPEGGRIDVEVEQCNGHARASVRDSGPGIPELEFARIFERFSSDRSRRTAGTGLGLPIARAIAEAHGGTLQVASPGGAEFRLKLPILGSQSGRSPD